MSDRAAGWVPRETRATRSSRQYETDGSNSKNTAGEKPISFLQRVHPESKIDGFNKSDGTILFFSFVWACILRNNAQKILDFGAGRGAFYYNNTAEKGSLFRKYLQDIRNTGAKVTACDIDPVVRDHPCSDLQVQIEPGKALPFKDESFDIIVSDHTFEHIAEPDFVARELLRILTPGGYICARTPSKYGYVALISSLIPNRFHTAMLRRAQPGRMAEDVFPTVYKLNTLSQIRRHFSGCDVTHYFFSGEPSYAFGNQIVYGMLRIFHRLLPGPLNTSVCLFIRKPGRAQSRQSAPSRS